MPERSCKLCNGCSQVAQLLFSGPHMRFVILSLFLYVLVLSEKVLPGFCSSARPVFFRVIIWSVVKGWDTFPFSLGLGSRHLSS